MKSLGDGSFFACGIGLELPRLFLYNIPNSSKMPDERKKEMKKVRNIVTMVCALAAAAALWPLFLLVNVFLDVAALFLRDLEWKVIPHVGAVNNAKAPTS